MPTPIRTLCALAAGFIACGPAHAAPKPANAVYYEDCFADAGAKRQVDRDGRYLRLACYGEPARRFYEALGARDPNLAFERTFEGRTYRWTQKPVKDTYGLDHCWAVAAPARGEPAYGCVLIFPAGQFLDG